MGLRAAVDRRRSRVAFSTFTDPQAAMLRIQLDAPGPGQERAIHIRPAGALYGQGNPMRIRWAPEQRWAIGNEVADTCARKAAGGQVRMTEKAVEKWRQDIVRRDGQRAFPAPDSLEARGDRFYQPLSGHAMTAVFLKEG